MCNVFTLQARWMVPSPSMGQIWLLGPIQLSGWLQQKPDLAIQKEGAGGSPAPVWPCGIKRHGLAPVCSYGEKGHSLVSIQLCGRRKHGPPLIWLHRVWECVSEGEAAVLIAAASCHQISQPVACYMVWGSQLHGLDLALKLEIEHPNSRGKNIWTLPPIL